MQDETQKPRKKGPDRSEGLGWCGKRSGRDRKGRKRAGQCRRNGFVNSTGRSALYEGSKTRPAVQRVSGADGMRACLDISLQSSGMRYRIRSVLRNVRATNGTCRTEICGKLCDGRDRIITRCPVPNHNEQVGLRENHSCLEQMYGRPRNGDGIVPIISPQCTTSVLT